MRILLKLSGEFFSEKSGLSLVDFGRVNQVAREISKLKRQGIELAVVVGAGNIYRGRNLKQSRIKVVYAHYMGMVGTVINAIALKAVFDKLRVKVLIQSEFLTGPLTQKISPVKARNFLKKGHIVVFAGGTGRPGVTTDTAAVLRAKQIKADIIYKATKVSGIYDKDPLLFKDARLIKRLSFQEAIRRKLGVMDLPAFQLAAQFQLPIRIFKWQSGCLLKALTSESYGSLIS